MAKHLSLWLPNQELA